MARLLSGGPALKMANPDHHTRSPGHKRAAWSDAVGVTATPLVERAQAAKARVDIVALVSRDVALRKRGRDHWGLCPFHAEKTASFRVDSARQNFKCFGCAVAGDEIDYLMARDRTGFTQAVELLEIEAGIRPDSQGRRGPLRAPRPCPGPVMPDKGEIARTEAARVLWRESRAIAGTPAETYLRGRGITIPLPPSLRFHPGAYHEDTGLRLPCMVAAVQAPDGKLSGVFRTWIKAGSRGKADIPKPKKALGVLGGGAVRLAPAPDRVWLCEGTEDAMSVAQLFQEPAWAVLGTAGFGNINLPEAIKTVILAPDRDDAGQAVIEPAAARLAGQGREVRIARPQTEKDWNEALAGAEERAGIMEFDGEVVRQDASRAVAREVLRGRS